MADAPPGADQTAPQTRSLLGYLPIIVVVLLLQAAGAYFLIEKVLFKKQKAAESIGQGIVDTIAEEAGFKDPPDMLPKYDEPEEVVDLEEMQTNPAGTEGSTVVFFKLSLGVAPRKVADDIKHPETMARVKDDIVAVFSSHSAEMMDQPDDKRAIREEIKVRVNAYLQKGQVVDVYLEKIYLQVNQ